MNSDVMIETVPSHYKKKVKFVEKVRTEIPKKKVSLQRLIPAKFVQYNDSLIMFIYVRLQDPGMW
jgi:hypothetical protein